MKSGEPHSTPSFAEIAREWGRIGCTSFGGPPTQIAMLRELCVARRRWLGDSDFERALAATNLLPGPAATQLAIYCAWRLRGPGGGLVGGLALILPGLVAILALSALFLSGTPPTWLRGAGLGAGAAVAAVAVAAGLTIARPIWARAVGGQRPWLLAYGLAGAAAAALAGPGLVLVLLACGVIEVARRRLAPSGPGAYIWLAGWRQLRRWPVHPARQSSSAWALLASGVEPGGTAALVWTAFKVGALAFGGGFVIVPLMQADAVNTYHWMTHEQFLTAVALGQVTPGPILQTVAAVGYSAAGLAGGMLAAAVAFAPSFAFVLLGAPRLESLVANERVVAFLAGAAPAAAGAIIGAAIPLAASLSERWQYFVLAGAAVSLLLLGREILPTLLLAGAAGVAAALLGAPIPR